MRERYTMHKLNNVSVKGYDFTATVYDYVLTNKMLDILGIDKNSDYSELEVEGTFTVSGASSDDPHIEVYDLIIIGTKTGETFRGPLGYGVQHCDIDTRLTVHTPQWGECPKYNTLELTEDDIDIDALIDDILEQGDYCNWQADEQAALCDYYFDTMGDR